MEFGIPRRRKVVERETERYPNKAVLTLEPTTSTDNGAIRTKLTLSNTAATELGFTEGDKNEIAFSFDPNDKSNNYLINANDIETGSNIKVYANNTFSNKETYEYLADRLGHTNFNTTLALELVHEGDMYTDRKVFKLRTLVEDDSRLYEKTTNNTEVENREYEYSTITGE